MNIVIIGPAHPLRGGLSTFNARLAGVLQEQGHTVAIHSFSLQYPSILFPGKSQYTDEPAPKDLTIYSSINSINPLNWIRVGNRIKKDRPDLIIVRYWMPFMGPSLGTILRRVKKNKHTKVFCIADNIIPHEKRPGDSAFTSYFIKPVDAFITMSKVVLKELNTLTTKPALFNPHPLYDNFGAPVAMDIARKKLGLDAQGKYILFFGFIRKYKGLDILLEAMNDEQIKQSGIQLIIAGEFYEPREQYDQLIEQYNLSGSIKLFTEFIPNEEVPYYFCAADLIVQPYRSATQSGITQVAYQFEKPMVVTNVGGLHEVVKDGETGFVVAPEPKQIADAILRFYQPNSLPNLKAAMQMEKAKYSWKTFTDTLFSLLHSK
jgi:glycosyltransferase involved in cell wall biosynthesis